MEGNRLILNDGSVIEGGRAGYSDRFLWLFFKGYTMQQAAMVFFDPSKTAKIIYQYGEMESMFNGFTVCLSLMTDADGEISVCMAKG